MSQAYEFAEAAMIGIAILGGFKLYLSYKRHKDETSHKTYEKAHEYELQVRARLTTELLKRGIHQSEIEIILRNTMGPISSLDDIKNS